MSKPKTDMWIIALANHIGEWSSYKVFKGDVVEVGKYIKAHTEEVKDILDEKYIRCSDWYYCGELIKLIDKYKMSLSEALQQIPDDEVLSEMDAYEKDYEGNTKHFIWERSCC